MSASYRVTDEEIELSDAGRQAWLEIIRILTESPAWQAERAREDERLASANTASDR